MGGGHDNTLRFHRLSKAEHHSQKEGGKVVMASSFPLLGSGGVWSSSASVTLPEGRGEETVLPLLAVGSGIGVVEAAVSSRVPVLERRDLEAADIDVLFSRWRVWSWSPSIPLLEGGDVI